jgi:hypothetical protein
VILYILRISYSKGVRSSSVPVTPKMISNESIIYAYEN